MIPKTAPISKFPQDFRQISLISAMAKIAAKIILKRIEEEVDELNILPEEQFGFRNNHSTELQVARLVEHAAAALGKKKATGAVILDVSKAFDRFGMRA